MLQKSANLILAHGKQSSYMHFSLFPGIFMYKAELNYTGEKLKYLI